MLHLILAHGEKVVFDAGIECLGFPGTLITHRGEAEKLEAYIYNKDIKENQNERISMG